MVENNDPWQYCINCISWSTWSCIFDIMWFHDVRVHVTIVLFCKSVWKTTKLLIWKDVLFCVKTQTQQAIFSWFESSSNNLIVKFQLLFFWIAFMIACLGIDEWWISSQNHNLANLFVVIQSTNSMSSRGKKHILGFDFSNISIHDDYCKKRFFC